MQHNAYFLSHKGERQDNVHSLITPEFQISRKIRIGDDLLVLFIGAQTNVTKVNMNGVHFTRS